MRHDMSPAARGSARRRAPQALVGAACLVALAVARVPAGSAQVSPAAGSERLQVFAGIEPVAFLVQRVAGPSADVGVLVGAGRDAHTYEPSPSQMVRLAECRAYFSVGLPFEETLVARVRALNPDLTVVATDAGILRRAGAPDPHVWMSPRNAKAMASAICRALAAVDPPRAAEYRRNLEGLARNLDALDAEIAALLAPFRGASILVYHPAFGYFADAYGLTQVAVEDAGKEPGPKALAALIERARAEGIRVVFVQPQFSTLSAEAMAREIGGTAVAVDPLAREYIRNLRSVARAVAAALTGADRAER